MNTDKYDVSAKDKILIKHSMEIFLYRWGSEIKVLILTPSIIYCENAYNIQKGNTCFLFNKMIEIDELLSWIMKVRQLKGIY